MGKDTKEIFTAHDPRRRLLNNVEWEACEKRGLKQLQAVLVEDLFSVQARQTLRLARDSYNEKGPMHLMLDFSRFGSRGQLWLAGINATSRAEVLESNGITHIWAAGYQRQQTQDARFQFYPCYDGTGVMAGDITFSEVLRHLVLASHLLLRGYRFVICCRNGAHRSALLVGLLLMLLTGRGPGDIHEYMKKLRCLVDLTSKPPNRKEVGRPIDFMEAKKDEINACRQKERIPICGLNEVLSKDAFMALASNVLKDARDLRKPAHPVLPPPVRLQPAPGQSAPVQLTPAVKSESGSLEKKGGEDNDEGESGQGSAAEPKTEVDAGTAGDSEQAAKKLKTEEGVGIAGGGGAQTPSAEPEQAPKKPKAEADAGTAGVVLKTKAEAGADAASSSTDPSAKKQKTEVDMLLSTLLSMRKNLLQLARVNSEKSAEGGRTFEEEVDYGDDEDVDVEVASQVLLAGDEQSRQLLELLNEEQRRLAEQLEEALAKRTAEVTEEELVETAWLCAPSRRMRRRRPSASCGPAQCSQ